MYDLHNLFGIHFPTTTCLIGPQGYFAIWKVDTYTKRYKTKSGEVREVRAGRYVYFADTGRHLTGWSLAKIGKVLGIPKIDIGDLHPEDLPRRDMERYCDNDAKIAFLAAWNLQEEYNKLGTSMKFTVGSSSLELFRRMYMKEGWTGLDDEHLLEIGQAFYGGRTEAFWYGELPKENGPYYFLDFNSAYPSVMRDLILPHPDRSNCRIVEEPPHSVIDEFEGASLVTIQVPDQKYPPLPFREDTGDSEKLLFPVGTLTGWYCHNELRYSIRHCDSVLLHVHKTYLYEKTGNYLREFVEDIYAYRMTGGFAETVGKLLGNGFFGKTCQRNLPSEMIPASEYLERRAKADEQFNPQIVYERHAKKVEEESLRRELDDEEPMTEEEIEELLLAETEAEYERLVGRDIGWFPSKENPITIEMQTGDPKLPRHTNMIWGAYITAAVRCRLHAEAVRLNALYCDTDSILTTQYQPPSEKLGDLALKEVWSQGLIQGPKNYSRFITHKVTKENGKQKLTQYNKEEITLKGVPRKKGWYLADCREHAPLDLECLCLGEGKPKWKQTDNIQKMAQLGYSVRFLKPMKFRELFKMAEENCLRPLDDSLPDNVKFGPVPIRANVWHVKSKKLYPKVDKRNGTLTGGWTKPLEVGNAATKRGKAARKSGRESAGKDGRGKGQ